MYEIHAWRTNKKKKQKKMYKAQVYWKVDSNCNELCHHVECAQAHPLIRSPARHDIYKCSTIRCIFCDLVVCYQDCYMNACVRARNRAHHFAHSSGANSEIMILFYDLFHVNSILYTTNVLIFCCEFVHAKRKWGEDINTTNGGSC